MGLQQMTPFWGGWCLGALGVCASVLAMDNDFVQDYSTPICCKYCSLGNIKVTKTGFVSISKKGMSKMQPKKEGMQPFKQQYRMYTTGSICLQTRLLLGAAPQRSLQPVSRHHADIFRGVYWCGYLAMEACSGVLLAGLHFLGQSSAWGTGNSNQCNVPARCL